MTFGSPFPSLGLQHHLQNERPADSVSLFFTYLGIWKQAMGTTNCLALAMCQECSKCSVHINSSHCHNGYFTRGDSGTQRLRKLRGVTELVSGRAGI